MRHEGAPRLAGLVNQDEPLCQAAGQAVNNTSKFTLRDDTELFKQFSDNESLPKWPTDMIFALTYEPATA
jgi:hypothetical protein